MADHFLDASGLKCPLPVLRARKAMKDLAAGETIEIRATDPAAEKDFPAFCEMTGDKLLAAEVTDGGYRFVIRKS
ncbi:MAG: sulfurtransferase TusA family protein [Alphaproteobacteria bacterium]